MRYACTIFYFALLLLVGCTPSGSDPVGDFLGIDTGTGAAGLTFSPENLAFGSVVLGQSSSTSTITVTAATAITVTAVTLADSNYSLVDTDCVKALAKNATCTFNVKFEPVYEGISSGSVLFSFTVGSSGIAKTLAFALSGTGATDDSTPGNVVVIFSPQAVDFSNVTVGQSSSIQTVKLYAAYTKDIFLNTINVNNQNYSIIAEDCPESTIALTKGSFCSIQLKFSPLAAGTLGSSLKITYGLEAGQSNLIASLALSGTGVGQLSFDGLESYSATTTTSTTLNWTDISGASFYLIYRVTSGTASLVATQAAPASSYGITGLTAATSYTYRVNAINSAGDGDGNSNDLSVTTDAQGSFTAVADLAIAEGATGSTPAFSCSDGGGNAATYTLTVQSDTDTNCAINSGKATCTAVNYKTGHSAWASSLSVRCDINGSSFTNSFAVNVSDTNRAPSLTAIGNQSIIAGAAITGVDADDGGDDADVDTDTLLYTCTYGNDQGTAAGTACASLPNTSYSFNTGTGALAWTSSTAAAVGNASTIYTFTITASDQQGAPLTDTETFTVTVAPAVALASKPDLIPINSSALVPGAAMTQIDYDNTVASNDTNVTYTCHFDSTIDGSVTAAAGNECDDDLDTYGAASFNTSTGVFDWTPASTTSGIFEFYVTATLGSASANDLFVVLVQEQYTLTNLLSDLDARYATGSASQSGAGDWEDISSNNFDGNQTNGTWSGAGTAANAYQLEFNGTTSSMDVGTLLNGETKTMISAWINSDDNTQSNKVILSTGADTGNGIMVTQSPTTTGALRLYTGSAGYVALVNSHSPIFHARMNEAAGNVVDTVAGLTGTKNGTPIYSQTGVLYDGDTSISFDGNGDYFQFSDATFPSAASSTTLTAWAYPRNASNDVIAVYGTATVTQSFGVFYRGSAGATKFSLWSWGEEVQSTDAYPLNHWYHVAVTYDGATARLYVNGELAGSAARTWSIVLNNFRIGGNLTANGADFDGFIDEVSVFGSVLTAAQIRRLYQAGIGCETTNTITNNVWNHLGVVFDGTTASFHLNGRQECSQSPEGTFTASTNLTAGATSAGANYWDGSIADVKTYSQGSSTKIKTNYDYTANRFREHPILTTLPTSGLVLFLDPANYLQGSKFGGTGCSITSWFDISSGAHDGTLTSFTGCGVSSGFNGDGSTGDPYRLTFDGTGDIVTIADHADFAVSPTLTVSAWVNASGGLPVGTAIVSQGDNGTNNMAWFLMNSSPTTNFQLYVSENGAGTDRMYSLGSQASFDNTWHFITASFSANDIKLYLDAALDGSPTVFNNGSVDGIYDSTVNAVVGGYYNNGTPTKLYTGSIGGVMIWNRVLSSSEVSQACNAMVSRFSGASCN